MDGAVARAGRKEVLVMFFIVAIAKHTCCYAGRPVSGYSRDVPGCGGLVATLRLMLRR